MVHVDERCSADDTYQLTIISRNRTEISHATLKRRPRRRRPRGRYVLVNQLRIHPGVCRVLSVCITDSQLVPAIARNDHSLRASRSLYCRALAYTQANRPLHPHKTSCAFFISRVEVKVTINPATN